MAVLASETDVCAGQRELGGVVVELRTRPLDRGVTDRTVGRETRGYVVRVCRRLVLRQMAARTGGRGASVLATHMARCAWGAYVSSGQGELRVGIVIERRSSPLHSGVTGLASGREG